jgi:peptidoglycan DL-endopeptidase CwlO
LPSDDASIPTDQPTSGIPECSGGDDLPSTRRPSGAAFRPSRKRRLIGSLISLGVAGSMAFAVPAATAAPSPTINEVQSRVDKLQEQAEQASEDYNETREKLHSINVRLKAAQEKLKRQHAEVVKARAQVGRLAAETYRRGELSTLDVVLGDDPSAVLAQAGYLPSLGDRQSGAMKRLAEGEKKLRATQAEIKAQQDKAEMAEIRMRLNKNTVNRKLGQAKAELNRLKAAQRAALARAQARTANAGVPAAAIGGGGKAVCNGMAVDAPTAAAKKAIQFACAQLGDPYVWAAAGPNAYDCSGLVLRAYQAAGISLPHSSAMQATYGRRVSIGSLQPGDLVFFHSPISHVGIYLGGGLMVHAPHTGDVVRVASLWTTPSAAVRF